MVKVIISFLLITIVSVLLFIFKDKLKIKELYKQIIIGVIFGGIAIFCNWFTYKNVIYFSNFAVLLCGVLFGGPAGLVAGLIGALERFIFINHASIEIIKFSAPITLLISGLASLVVPKFVIDDKKIKWYFGFIAGAAIEMINIILMIIFRINNIDSVYSVIKIYGIIQVALNSVALVLILLLFAYLPKGSFIFSKKNAGIQLKTQVSILLSILVGFISVSSIAYQVLKDNSDKTTVSTITKSLEDVEENIVADVNGSIVITLKDVIKLMKMEALQKEYDEDYDYSQTIYGSYEGYYNEQTNNIKIIASSRRLVELSLIRQDGTIKFTTSDYIRSLSNISEYNIPQFDITSNDNVLVDEFKYQYNDYAYIDQIGKDIKHVYAQYTKNDDSFYILAGFDTNEYYSYIRSSVAKGLAKRHAGEKGFLIVADNENNVISTPTDLISDTISINLNNKRNLSLFTLNSEDYYSYIDEFGNLDFIVLMNKEECDRNMNSSLKTTLLSEIAVFGLLYLIIYLTISFDVIRPLRKVNKSLNSITSGNLDEKVNECSNQEFLDLSNDINATVDSLKEYMGREAKLIKKDLDFAKNIQLSALPKLTKEYTSNPNFDIYATMNTAKEVGGDFYDFELLDDKHLFILIADVSGKGVPAAMFMMQSKTIIKTLVENSKHIDVAITKANQKICETNSASMFVTCWCGVLNLETGILEYVNAGHNPPLVKKNGGKFSYLSSKAGFVLAGFDGFTYSSEKITLNSGDELFLYTDGVTEANSLSKELYGEPRLLEFLNNASYKQSRELCELLNDDLNQFSKDVDQFDDITMLCIKYIGNKN